MNKEANILNGQTVKKDIDDTQLSEVIDVLGYMRSLSTVAIERLASESILVREWTAYWIANFCSGLKKNTAVYYESVCEQHINRVLGGFVITELTSETIQLFINSLSIGVGIDHPLSPKSVKNVHGILHKCLDSAVRYEYLTCNPSTNITLPFLPHRDINVMTNAMITEFIKRIHGTEKEPIYLFALFTGMRESEIIGLTWDCINFDTGSINIHRQLAQDRKTRAFSFAPLKNNKARVIYPSEFVMKLLAKVKKDNPETVDNFVFVNKRFGTHYTISAVYKTFKRVVSKMGYPELRVHDLRHTYAVLSLQAGDDIKSLQHNLGHYSSAFTLDVYGHFTIDMQKTSAKKMSDFISEIFPELIGH